MSRKAIFLMAPLLAACQAGPVSAPLTGPTDAQIVAIYAQVNSFDIEIGFLASAKGSSADVRGLGRHVAQDHLSVRAAILDLAREEGIGYELPVARIAEQREHDAVVARLSALEGAAFDAAYLEREIAFHAAAISAVRDLFLPEADNAPLKGHFTAVLPAFEQHLASTRQIAAGGPATHSGHQ